MNSPIEAPVFSSRRSERLGLFAGCGCIPLIGLVTYGGLWLIARTDAMMAGALSDLGLIIAGVVAFLSPFAWVAIGRGQSAQIRETEFIDALAEEVGDSRIVKKFPDFPRVWCRIQGRMFEVLEYQIGRRHVSWGEPEDAFRLALADAIDVPTARIPPGRQARITVVGDVDAGMRLLVASKGPLAWFSGELSRLGKTESGDPWFDARVVVYSDEPARVAALLSDADKRRVLAELICCNGFYINSIFFSPKKSARDSGVVQRFARHPSQSGAQFVKCLNQLVLVAQWTRDRR